LGDVAGIGFAVVEGTVEWEPSFSASAVKGGTSSSGLFAMTLSQ